MALPPLIPREALFGNPDRLCVRISPDGRQLGCIAPLNGVLNVWVRPVEGGGARAVTNDTHRGIREFSWAYDGRSLLYVQDRDGDENWHVYTVDLETGQARDLTPYEGVMAAALHLSPAHPDTALVALNRDNPQLHDLYHVQISTGATELAVRNPGNVIGWDVDWDLRVIGALAQLPDGGTAQLGYNPESGEWSTLLTAPFGESIWALGVTPDHGALYMSSSLGNNTSRVLLLSLADGRQTPLAWRDGVDFDGGFIVHPTCHHLQAVSFTRAHKEWKFLDETLKADFEKAAKLAPGEPDLISRDLEDRRWIMAFTSDVHPVSYYFFNRETGQGEFLFTQNTALQDAQLAHMQAVEIKSRDGLTLVCYLTLPEGVPPENLPLVLNVHGGPWYRDHWGLNSEAQWLANRGYAVLQVNYRGSTGFGKGFVNASNREWGGKMHDDLIDAVNWAIGEGIADPDRVAIFGWSYGGYAALVGMTFTPDVFAVGVAGVGISNLVSWYHTIPPYWEPFREQLKLRVGDGDTEEEFLRSRSPLFRVDQIRNPLMIAQGANDPRVPRAEADQMVEALRKRGVDVKYLLFEDEGHGFARPENRLTFYTAAEGFLAEVLGGRAQE